LNEIRPIQWDNGALKLLDQTRLPAEQVIVELNDYLGAVAAIRDMQVRGAPAIGVTAAYAVVMAASVLPTGNREAFLDQLRGAGELINAARPTAVNLQWAVRRMLEVARSEPDMDRINDRLLAEAKTIQAEDEEINRGMGEFGRDLMPEGGAVLTHCNTGALATSAFGTALGVIRAGWESGRRFQYTTPRPAPSCRAPG